MQASFSKLILVVFIFLLGIAYVGWYNTEAKVLGIICLAYVAVWLLEALGVIKRGINVNR